MAKKQPAPKLEDLEKEYRRLMQTDTAKAKEIFNLTNKLLWKKNLLCFMNIQIMVTIPPQ